MVLLSLVAAVAVANSDSKLSICSTSNSCWALISCVIDVDRVAPAVKALHSAFELSGEDTIAVEEPSRAST